MTDMTPEARREIEELLPFLANDTLEGDERARDAPPRLDPAQRDRLVARAEALVQPAAGLLLVGPQQAMVRFEPFFLNIMLRDMAHALGLDVVSEGIETEGQRDVIVSEGCAYWQGFLRAAPMRSNALLQMLGDAA